MARPTKYTPEKSKLICDKLRIGATRTAAVGSSGVIYHTFLDWLARYPNFHNAIREAECEAELRFASRITKEANKEGGDWRAAESWLKRRRRLDWGDTLDITKLSTDSLISLLGGEDTGGVSEAARLPALSPHEP